MLRLHIVLLATVLALPIGSAVADTGSRYHGNDGVSGGGYNHGAGLGGTDAGARTDRSTLGSTRNTVSSAPGHLW